MRASSETPQNRTARRSRHVCDQCHIQPLLNRLTFTIDKPYDSQRKDQLDAVVYEEVNQYTQKAAGGFVGANLFALTTRYLLP
ncbi:MAG: hypothetical protein Q7T21_14215 [Gallionella sp.]|nr:hypothetical protein [Gallionella sp.]